jgi:hypothetical protein
MFVLLIVFWAVSIAGALAWVAWALVRRADHAHRLPGIDERKARSELYGGPRHIEIQPKGRRDG